MPTGEYVSCILWNNLFHITGTDIVRCLAFRFQAFGRPVKNAKKFEEGIFSDLRNLKSGTDASLEEPKSAFLDFLYKNNCIRTQKKQKVFYWYSVPHDRLFLDALERDLKREKMSQEPTTMAVSEPALSFEYDSSQSLFEQLTKAQQTSSSTYNAANGPPQAHHHFPPAQQPQSSLTLDTSAASAAMPPPSIVPQHNSMSHSGMPQSFPDDHVSSSSQMPTNSQMGAPPVPLQIQRTREQSYNPVGQYDRAGNHLSSITTRHSSMPAYMEYSPAPSFVSSAIGDDYSTRGMSFEPMTPPNYLPTGQGEFQQEDMYAPTSIDASQPQPYGSPMMQMANGNLGGANYSTMIRGMNAPASMSALEGSPTYKQRRRRSSVNVSLNTAVPGVVGPHSHATPHSAHRPSGLHRAISQSAVSSDGTIHDSPIGFPAGGGIKDFNMVPQPSQQGHESGVSGKVLHKLQTEGFSNSTNDTFTSPAQHSAVARTAGGVFRRARSATLSEMGPYNHKSHSCPIPMCGRLFKRLEHLKRYV